MSKCYIRPAWLTVVELSIIYAVFSCLTRYVHGMKALQPVFLRCWGRWEALHICMHVNELAKCTGQGMGRTRPTGSPSYYVFQHPISVISKISCMRVTPPILVRSIQGVFRRYAVRKGSVRSTQKSCYIVRRHLFLLLKGPLFIKKHTKCDIPSQIILTLRSRFLGVISAFINLNNDFCEVI